MAVLRNNWVYEQGPSPGLRIPCCPRPARYRWESEVGLSASPSDDSQCPWPFEIFLHPGSCRSFSPQTWLLQSHCSSPSPLASTAHRAFSLNGGYSWLWWKEPVLYGRARQTDEFPVPLLTGCVTLSGLLPLSESPVLHLWSGEILATSCACELLRGITEQVMQMPVTSKWVLTQ